MRIESPSSSFSKNEKRKQYTFCCDREHLLELSSRLWSAISQDLAARLLFSGGDSTETLRTEILPKGRNSS